LHACRRAGRAEFGLNARRSQHRCGHRSPPSAVSPRSDAA
jgi:hypothetical protein